MNRKMVCLLMVLCFGIVFGISAIAVAQTKPAPKPEKKAPAEPEKINVNKATEADLASVPGISKTLAKAICDYRKKSGPFKSVEDLLKVPGMTKKILDDLYPEVDKKTGDVILVPLEEPSLKPSKC